MQNGASYGFRDFLTKAKPNQAGIPWPVLALDPGGTTGFAVFDGGDLVAAGQVKGEGSEIERLIQHFHPRMVVSEEFRLYPWMMKVHTWSDVPTLQHIGAIKYICEVHNLPIALQSARNAKGFATNKKLKEWGLWQVSQEHANDAIRHGVYWLSFGGSGVDDDNDSTAKRKRTGSTRGKRT